MGRKIICKHCGEDVGEFYSQLENHLWSKHRDIMMKFLYKNAEYRQSQLQTCISRETE